ncbi:hypothetical protein HYPSUDRAFT_895122 [Hypholoma sublateritium FD-334 SS-4]|uniref:Uncharacterized protein n=1 Tax=Hypholoma sublateritium (strain FD-334 SS-4) TaxID=945553 RepID=A0A0D2KXP9_HYPSF|nr:hypothetical protein HYPSUDRAFT_895122 [Hypholoma sublateritium FD-334 SS-4]
MRFRLFFETMLNKYLQLKDSEALSQMLGDILPSSGIGHHKYLTKVLEDETVWDLGAICAINEGIGFSHINPGVSRENPYIHTALKISKSLAAQNFDRNIWSGNDNINPYIRDRNWEADNIHEWNRVLVLELLIPILDSCPRSDKLLAVINRRIRRICLTYTPRRHLRDAVYRYIRRTSAAGNN